MTPSGLASSSSVTLTTNNSLVHGQTLTGAGNLPGTTDPKLRNDGRLTSSSPLRGAGGASSASAFDMDLQPRPASARDIGVNQWVDVDADGLPDGYEITTFGSKTAISGLDDADNDGLSNAGEYDQDTDMFNPDTDGDGVKDGVEIAYGLNPHVLDSDDLGVDLNQDGLLESIGIQLGYSASGLDSDGDGVSNADEALACTDPLRADSDGDGVPDSADAFPLDPLLTSLPSDPLDVTPPVITLTAPWYAVAQ